MRCISNVRRGRAHDLGRISSSCESVHIVAHLRQHPRSHAKQDQCVLGGRRIRNIRAPHRYCRRHTAGVRLLQFLLPLLTATHIIIKTVVPLIIMLH